MDTIQQTTKFGASPEINYNNHLLTPSEKQTEVWFLFKRIHTFYNNQNFSVQFLFRIMFLANNAGEPKDLQKRTRPRYKVRSKTQMCLSKTQNQIKNILSNENELKLILIRHKK